MCKRVTLIGLVFIVACEVKLRADEEEAFFEKHVRPILVHSCLECHGPEHVEGGLQLTSREMLLKGGDLGPAVELPFPDQSRLMEAVRQQGDLRMPPDSRLSEDQLNTLARWIEMGAPWPESHTAVQATGEMVVTDQDREHWAFRPIVEPPLPNVQDREWPQSPVDHFILARLESAELRPATRGDRRMLLRRAYYDLLGIPPSWKEVRAFTEDPRPTDIAFSEVVDRLLASPHYGERWGRHWLDVARYADTKDGVLMFGYDRMYPFAYTYRDHVIRAMNEDRPYDQFVVEQLAADRIEPAVESGRLAALGLLTLGRLYDNNLHDVIDDRIDTVTRGFLGLTVSCARCHDHKYDPIPTADYYSLYGVFASCESPLEPPPVAALDTVPGRAEFERSAAEKREELRQFVNEQFELLTVSTRDRIGDYLIHVATTEPDPLETAIFFLSLAPDDLRPPIVARWRRLLRQRAQADDPVFGLWQELLALSDGSESPSAEPQPIEGRAADVVPKANSDVISSEESRSLSADQESYSRQAAAVIRRWREKPRGTEPGEVNPLVLEALTDVPLAGPADVARTYGELLHRIALENSKNFPSVTGSVSGSASQISPDPAHGQLLALMLGPSSPNWFPKSETRSYMSRVEKDAYAGKIRELDRMAAESPVAAPRAMVVYDAETLHDPRVFVRGNASQPGRSVARQAPAIISPGGAAPFEEGSGRLELARAITADDNPLTARVFVNRVWMHHFGEPLVSTPSDFGRRSTPPTHPELLDYLAARFMREGWSTKKLHRWILQSATYQQTSLVTEIGEMEILEIQTSETETTSSGLHRYKSGTEVDPDNRLLWRMNRRRLELEAMRDTLLEVAGRLDRAVGGRPVDIVQEPEQRRRTIYGLVDRQSLPGMFRAFDFASPDQTVERRPQTMVPQQALFALNSPFVLIQARALAARSRISKREPANSEPFNSHPASTVPSDTGVTGEGVDDAGTSGPLPSQASEDDRDRIVHLYRLALAREPEQDELEASLSFLAAPRDEESQLSRWEQLAHVLLLSNELMYID